MRSLLLPFVFFCCLPLVAQSSGDSPQLIEGPQTAPPTKSAVMNNDSVIRMAKAGLGEDLIVQTINTQPGQYSTDADSLVALKTAGTLRSRRRCDDEQEPAATHECSREAGHPLRRQRDRRLLQGSRRAMDCHRT